MSQQKMNELPKGWSKTSVGDFLDIHNGKRKPISLTERVNRKGQFPYYGATGIIDYLDGYTHEGEYILIGEDGANLLSKSKPLAFLADGKYWVNNHAHTAKCPLDCPNKYIEKYINSLSLEPWVTGSAQPKLNKGNLEKIPLPLPPLPEQKRIVEKLDSLLAQVDTIQQRLNTLPNIIKRFRQSILAVAVSGKLTEQWRGENECQKSTFQIKKEIKNYRYETWVKDQEAKFLAKGKVPKNDKWKDKYKEVLTELSGEEKELPSGWVYETLEGLIYISARIGWKGLKADEYTEEGPLFLSVHGLNHGQYVDLSRAYHITKERYEESPEIKLKNEDILVCKDGAGIGKIAIIKGLTELATINSSLLLIRSGKYFLTDYLYYFLAGPEVQRIVQERMTGSAVPHLFQRDVKEFILEVPPIEEQTEIVRLVEQYFALADTLEKHLKNAKQRVDNLTQAILAKAFKGELVPQDPSDEPAKQLLTRIKAAREQAEVLEKAAKKVAKTKKK